MASDLFFSDQFQKLSFGDKGLRVIASGNTTASDEDFCAVQAVESSTITFNSNAEGGDTTVSSLSIPAGAIIYGNLEDINCTSGKVVCYLR